MRKSANDLAERIQRVHVDANLDTIARLMRELNISIGQLVEYMNEHVDDTISTGERLRQINQTRKKGRELALQRQQNLIKARETRKAKREELLQKADEVKAEPELTIEPMSFSLDNIDLSAISLGEEDE